MTQPKRILIAHEDREARAELRSVAEKSVDTVAALEASSFEMMIEALRDEPGIELVIVDLDLPGMFWEVGLRHLLDHHNGMRIVLLLSDPDRDKLRWLGAESLTLVSKQSPERALAKIVAQLVEGQDGSADSDERSSPALPLPTPFDPPVEALPPLGPSIDLPLTSRQTDVLRLLSEGYSNHEIAEALAIAEGTVKVHVNAAFRILGVHNRVSAATAFRQYVDERLAHSVGANDHH